jgi:hypothetical protein
MITDAQLALADNQAITATAASANQIDLQTARYLERTGAAGLRLVALVTTTFATLTSLTATVRQSAAANMGSPDVIATGPTVAAANLTAGKKLLDISWPSIAPVAAKRYLDMNFTVAGSDATAGAIWAGVVMDNEGGELKIGNTGGSVV